MTTVEVAKLLREIVKELEAITVPEHADDIAVQKLEEIQAQLATIQKKLEGVPTAVRAEYREFMTFLTNSPESGLKQLMDQWKSHVEGKSFKDGLFRWMIQISIIYLRETIRVSIEGLNALAARIEKQKPE